MRSAFRVLAYLIALGVAIQAAAVAYGFFALGKYIESGATVDKSTTSFPGDSGLAIHGIGGTIAVPALALLFLVSSFFVKLPGGVRWGLIVFVTTVVQVALGLFAHSIPALGVLHGIVALALFGEAVSAAMWVSRAARATATTAADATATSVV